MTLIIYECPLFFRGFKPMSQYFVRIPRLHSWVVNIFHIINAWNVRKIYWFLIAGNFFLPFPEYINIKTQVTTAYLIDFAIICHVRIFDKWFILVSVASFLCISTPHMYRCHDASSHFFVWFPNCKHNKST